MSDLNEKIDAYLLGQLSEEERSAFEEVLRNDPEVAKEYEFRKEMQTGVAEVQREELRDRIKEIAAGKLKVNITRLFLIAASVVIILGASWLFWTVNRPSSGQDLFAAYYHPKVQIDQPRTPDSEPTLADTLEERYATEDFEFLQLRLVRLPDSVKNRNLQMLEAVTLIELERDVEADQLLSSLMTVSAPEYSDEATWLKALLHMRNDQFEAAIAILQPIAEDEGKLHQQEALELLGKIGDR